MTVGAAAAWAVPVATFSMVVAPWKPAAMMVPAGAVGAVVLAGAQAVVLRRWLSSFPVRKWTAVSAVAAVVEWAVLALVVVHGERVGNLPAVGQVPLVAAGIVSVTFALGVGQWFVLRRWSDQAVLWIWANAVAWIMGATVFVAVAQPVRVSAAMTVTAATISVVAAVLLRGAVVAVITGVYLLHVLAEAHLHPVIPRSAGAPSDTLVHAGRTATRGRIGAGYPAGRAVVDLVRAFALLHIPGNPRLQPSSDAPAADR
ncbi:hypothetical protein [Nocardia carnea]|uniref:Uncharacterized protein n=1 Tax=Nocardia carnea TaxID=37328 RepID=A0ABW7TLL3_9NOCA|nr:hypothetical protein [Nocardia carnea]